LSANVVCQLRGELGGPECVLWLVVQAGASCVHVERRKRQLELRDSVVQARKSLRPLDPGIFHSIVLFQATKPIQTKQRLDKKTENQYKEKGQKHRKHKNTQYNNQNTKTCIHNYTTRSDFTKALLLALQRAASDFLALIIRVSKLGKTVKSSILATL